MPQPHNVILSNPSVRAALEDAWLASAPGGSGGHEEGGFVTTDAKGNLIVVRWPEGDQDSIRVPPHPNCKTGDSRIVATFHTHPNTGDDYLQEPSETDKRAVRDDPDLKDADYVGEFVISMKSSSDYSSWSSTRSRGDPGRVCHTIGGLQWELL